ncbi:hypothetical protein BC835DRAFT_1412109 [Cytidiella melzeri]|nr:hypothetical protein BC835DRAFT_1412109 [Cytidiella melzeri]
MSDLPWMVKAMPWFHRIVFLLVSIFSAIVLRSNINYIALTTNSDAFDVYTVTADPFSQFGLAVSIITLITLIPIRLAALIAPGAFICTVFFELLWFGILQCLWLGSAIWSMQIYTKEWKSLCMIDNDLDDVADVCLDVRFDIGFGIANFALTLLYYIPLVILACLAASHGKSVWWEGVRMTKFGYGKPNPLLQDPQSSAWSSDATLASSHKFNIDADPTAMKQV